MNIIGYRFKTPDSTMNNYESKSMSVVERKRRVSEGKFLKQWKNANATKQLAIYAKFDGSGRYLVGVVSCYDNFLVWHDVSTKLTIGLPHKIEGVTKRLPDKVMRDLCGISKDEAHVFAVRF